MKNFKINSPDDPEPQAQSFLYEIGTAIKFYMQNGELRSARQITVQFA